MKVKVILLLFFFSFSTTLQAQLSDFGETKSEELLLSQSESGFESDALILFEAGELYFTETLDLALTYHIRIKLFNEEAFEYGTHRITFNPRVRQGIEDLRASVHRFNSRGRTVADIAPDSIFQTNDIGNGLKEISFTIPGLEPGSVIEYSYTKIFGHPANIPVWIIQRDIPVLYNELVFWKDDYFEFEVRLRGTSAVDETLREKYRDSDFGIGTWYNWNSEYVPELPDPDFLYDRENYRSRIEFKLSVIDIDGVFTEDLTKTWEEIRNDLEADYYFAGQLVPNDEIKTISDRIRTETTLSKEAVQAVYDLVADTTVWNGEYSIKAEHPVTETFKGEPSSSAAINLLLTRMLRDIDVPADPVLISTRDNGYMYLDEIDTGQFNNLIVRITTGDEVYYLDASQGKRPVQLTPLNDLNKAGLLYAADSLRWIDIDAYDNSDIQVSVKGAMKQDGTITGQLSGKLTGYYSQDTSVDAEKIREWFRGEDQISSLKLAGPVETEYSQNDFPNLKFSSDSIRIEPAGTGVVGDTLKFSPLMAFRDLNNPFADSARTLPVELDFPFSRVFNTDIRLPEGYRISEIPEPITARLPSGKGRLLFVIQQVGDRLSFLMQFEINDDFFFIEDYGALREIYRLADEAKIFSIDLIKNK